MTETTDQLSKSDFLAWYNGEIARYRDIEWKIPAYSISVSYLTVIFATNQETKFLVSSTYFIITALSLYVIALLIAEINVHSKLLYFRERRTLLLKDKPHTVLSKNAWKHTNNIDILWFLGFTIFPLIVFISAIVTIVSQTN